MRSSPTPTVGEVALLFIDLDNFKAVNDSLGHGIGDTLLTAMSARCARSSARRRARPVRRRRVHRRAARPERRRDPVAVAEDLREAVRDAVVVEGTELFVSSSIGVSVNDRDGASAADLLRDADAAMYRAKARGRDCVEAFAPGTHETTVLALRTATELRRGLERGEVVPYFQPIVELTTGHVIGLRGAGPLAAPRPGLLAPDQFLPMAEETGLIDEIGATILEDALAQFARGGPATSRSPTPRWRSTSAPARSSTRPSPTSSPTCWPRPGSPPTRCGWRSPRPPCWPTSRRRPSPCATCAASACTSPSTTSAPGYSSLTYLKRFPVEAIKIDRGVRRRPRARHRGHDDRRGRRQPRALLRHRRDRRGPGDAAAAVPPAGDGLRPGPGLPVRPPRPGLHRGSRALRPHGSLSSC